MAKGYAIFTEDITDAAVIGQRHAAAHSNVIVIGGFEMPNH